MGSCHTERLHVTKLLLPLELISIDWSCNAVCAHVDSPTVGQKASTFELRPGEGGGGGWYTLYPTLYPLLSQTCHAGARDLIFSWFRLADRVQSRDYFCTSAK